MVRGFSRKIILESCFSTFRLANLTHLLYVPVAFLHTLAYVYRQGKEATNNIGPHTFLFSLDFEQSIMHREAPSKKACRVILLDSLILLNQILPCTFHFSTPLPLPPKQKIEVHFGCPKKRDTHECWGTFAVLSISPITFCFPRRKKKGKLSCVLEPK